MNNRLDEEKRRDQDENEKLKSFFNMVSHGNNYVVYSYKNKIHFALPKRHFIRREFTAFQPVNEVVEKLDNAANMFALHQTLRDNMESIFQGKGPVYFLDSNFTEEQAERFAEELLNDITPKDMKEDFEKTKAKLDSKLDQMVADFLVKSAAKAALNKEIALRKEVHEAHLNYVTAKPPLSSYKAILTVLREHDEVDDELAALYDSLYDDCDTPAESHSPSLSPISWVATTRNTPISESQSLRFMSSCSSMGSPVPSPSPIFNSSPDKVIGEDNNNSSSFSFS